MQATNSYLITTCPVPRPRSWRVPNRGICRSCFILRTTMDSCPVATKFYSEGPKDKCSYSDCDLKVYATLDISQRSHRWVGPHYQEKETVMSKSTRNYHINLSPQRRIVGSDGHYSWRYPVDLAHLEHLNLIHISLTSMTDQLETSNDSSFIACPGDR